MGRVAVRWTPTLPTAACNYHDRRPRGRRRKKAYCAPYYTSLTRALFISGRRGKAKWYHVRRLQMFSDIVFLSYIFPPLLLVGKQHTNGFYLSSPCPWRARGWRRLIRRARGTRDSSLPKKGKRADESDLPLCWIVANRTLSQTILGVWPAAGMERTVWRTTSFVSP